MNGINKVADQYRYLCVVLPRKKDMHKDSNGLALF